MIRIVSTGKTLASESFLEKKRRMRRKRLGAFGALLLVVAIAIVILLRHEKARLAEISVSGNSAVSAQAVASVVRDTISGYYFYLIPRDSVIFYPGREVRRFLRQKFPRFGIVEVSLSGPRTLEIKVVEREPFALYCSDSVYGIEYPDSRRDTCHFLDETGFIFAVAPNFSEGVYFIYSKDEPIENPPGKEFIEREEFWELNEFMAGLSRLGLAPRALEMGERDVAVTAEGGARVFIKRGDNLGLIFSNLETFLSADEIREDEDFLDKVSTLDLRTDNKVFYTFKD